MSLVTLSLAILLAQSAAPSGVRDASALQRAEAAAESLELEEALRQFRKALEGPGSLEERIRAYRGMGLTLAFMNKPTEARRVFETLLQLDPAATVPASYGPKIAKPFEAARRATQKRKPRLTLERDRYSGELVAEVAPESLPVTHLEIVARRKGTTQDASTRVDAEQVLAGLPIDPTWEVEAYATAEDAFGGVLLEAGSDARRIVFAPTTTPDPLSEAVASANQQARAERDLGVSDEGGSSKWPWIVGAVGVIGAGVVAGVLVTQGAGGGLSLPPAERVGRLP